MFSMLRRRMSYANVVATLALLFAMSGGALAASHYLITSAKQIKPSVLAQLKGKAGPAGPAGPVGAAGLAGVSGAAGEKGAAGSNGTNGANGKDGVSVTSSAASVGECKAGGTKFTSSSGTSKVCNGENGQTGFTETLPEGATETGIISYVWAAAGIQLVPISFPIPLERPLPEGKAHYILKNGEEINVLHEHVAQTVCKGSATDPTAERGNLCVYEISVEPAVKFGSIKDPTILFHNEAATSRSGATTLFFGSEGGAQMEAVFAVTG